MEGQVVDDLAFLDFPDLDGRVKGRAAERSMHVLSELILGVKKRILILVLPLHSPPLPNVFSLKNIRKDVQKLLACIEADHAGSD